MDIHKLNCRLCKRITNHDELYKKADKDEITYNFMETVEYLVVQCRGCENISFFMRYWNTQMVSFDYENNEYDEIWDETIYPNDMELKFKNEYFVQKFKYTPFELRSLYEQTIDNFRLGYYPFVAAGVRMIIEKLCFILEIKEGFQRNLQTGEIGIDKRGEKISRPSLEGKINGLYDNGYVLFKDLPILHAVRIIGNDGLHEIKTPSLTVLTKALEVIEYVLVTIFEKKQFAELHEIKK